MTTSNSEPSRPPPPGWPRIAPALYYLDAGPAIDWLCAAFGFNVRLKVEGDDGSIEHSELDYGDGLIMVSDVKKLDKFPHIRAPAQLGGGNTQSLMMYVDDVEAHCARARAHGAVIVKEPTTTDYGDDYWTDRGYQCTDLGGHTWWFYQRLRSPAGRAP